MVAPNLRRRPGHRPAIAIAALLTLTVSTLLACGGGSSSSTPTNRPDPDTPRTSDGSSVSALGEDGDPSPDPAGARSIGTFPVGRIHLDLADDSRITKEHGGEPEQDHRSLPTTVWYPATAEGDGTEPLDDEAPLIVFGHGSTRLAEHYEATLRAWASAGYVVAAPDFPLSKEGTPGGTDYGGVAEQTGDVSFVIDQLLAGDAEVDGRPIPVGDTVGVGGQSFGAITAIEVSANAASADPRITAFTAFAGMWFDLGEGFDIAQSAETVHGLLVHGDDDPTVPHDGSVKVQELLGDRALILTLTGGGHDDGFFGGIDDPLSKVVTEATVAFYDRWLKDDVPADDRLGDIVAASDGAAVLEPADSGT